MAMLAVIINFWPPIAGLSRPDSMKSWDTSVQRKSLDSVVNTAKEAVSEYRDIVIRPRVKVVYRTRTITEKPQKITLYVRNNGEVTEHHIQSDGGLFIVDASELISNDTEKVELQDKPEQMPSTERAGKSKSKNLWQRIFQK